MQKLAELCVRRPVLASVLVLILVVVGAAGFFQLGVDRYPNVDFANVTIITTQPGASARTIESEITDKVEEAVNTVSGIDEVRSNSAEGVSVVNVQFVLEKNGDVAVQEVRDRVGRIVGELPEGVDPPVIEKFDASAVPVISVALSRGSRQGSLRDLTEYADKTLRRRLESAPGVGRVDVLGGTKRQINVWLDAHAMRAQDLTVTDVTRALQAQNSEVPGGRLERGDREVTLRTEGRITSVEDFNSIRLRASGGGGLLRLRDVAQVEDGAGEVQSLAELNGNPTVTLQISKQSGANTVAVVHTVRERLAELQPDLQRRGFEYRVVNDQSEYIEASIHAVEEHLIVGSILAVGVVLLFLLNWRSALIAAVAVPTSLIATFGMMWALGFTLNTLTLLAVTLAIGIVIDDAIVVLENIYRFIEEKGMPPFQAAIEGTREIGLAVMATTLSLVAVFIPVAFMKGIVGRFMNSFGLTMAFAILVSLIVAFTLTPMMSARLLRSSHEQSHNASTQRGRSMLSRLSEAVSRPIRWVLDKIDDAYLIVLKWSMRRRWVIVLACAAALASIPFIGSQLPGGFLPKNDEAQFQVTLRAPEGTGLVRTGEVARDIAAQLRQRSEVEYTLTTVGVGGGETARNRAQIFVRLRPVETREATQDDLIAFARDRVLPRLANLGVRTTVGPASDFGGGGDVQLAVTGPDVDTLGRLSERLLARLRRTPGVAEADSSLVAGKPELSARVDRDLAAALGVQPQDVAQALNFLVGENEVTRYEEGSEQYEVHVRAAPEFRTDEAGLQLLTVPASAPQDESGMSSDGTVPPVASSNSVPIGQVVQFVPRTGPSSVRRLNRQREATISAFLQPGADGARVQNVLESELAAAKRDLQLGPEYRSLAVGDSREQAKAFTAFLVAFGLSLVFMYLILAAQFESWLHPVTILLSLPLTVPFALFALLLFGQGLNIFSMLGILVLFGVVKKNAILQIDHTIQLRERGMAREEAILQANRDRLRPILMTTLAFVAGMLPLLVSTGVGAGDNRAIGSVIFGGQTFSLLLTLLAVPVAYSLFDDLSTWLVRVRTKLFGGKPAQSLVSLQQDDSASET